MTLGKEERERNNRKVGNWREKDGKHKWEEEKTTEKNGKEEKNMECKKIEFKKRQKTRKKKKDKSKKPQATEREENEVENENREDGKRTREEISRGSSLLHTAIRGQKLQRILGMGLATVRRELSKQREKEKERCAQENKKGNSNMEYKQNETKNNEIVTLGK